MPEEHRSCSVVEPALPEDAPGMELQDRIEIRVREIRRARGLTQERLAELTERSVDTISLIERGRILPSLDTLEAIATELGAPISTLVDQAEPEASAEMIALRAKAAELVGRLDEGKLTVAVRQLAALAEMA